jgi:plasmid stabilization system protein ParE
VHEQVRRALLRKFPYALFYLFNEETIVVVACFHVRRSPADWQRRA